MNRYSSGVESTKLGNDFGIGALVFIGASALPETLHVLEGSRGYSLQTRLIGVLDDDSRLHGSTVCGIPVLGPLTMASELPGDVEFIFGIGSHRTRLERFEILERAGVDRRRFPPVIHESASVLPGAQIGFGTIIHPGVVIGQDALLHGFNLVFPNSIVASRNVLSSFAMVTSLVALTDRVQIGFSAFIGTGAAIAEGVSIGMGSSVSMGSVVYRDVLAGVSVMGNPAKPYGRASLTERFLQAANEDRSGTERKN